MAIAHVNHGSKRPQDKRSPMGEGVMTMPMMDTWNDRIDDLKMKRMLQGERKHGPLNLETDPRDFIREGIEELIDFLNFLEMAMLQGKLPFCKWASIDRDVRFTIWRLVGKG